MMVLHVKDGTMVLMWFPMLWMVQMVLMWFPMLWMVRVVLMMVPHVRDSTDGSDDGSPC